MFIPFYPNLFPSQINVISTNKQLECPLLQSSSAVNDDHTPYVRRTLLIFPRINGPNCSTSKIERIPFIPAGKWITRHTRPEFFYPYTNSTRSEDLFFLKKNNSTVEQSPFINFLLDTSLRATRGAPRLFLVSGPL